MCKEDVGERAKEPGKNRLLHARRLDWNIWFLGFKPHAAMLEQRERWWARDEHDELVMETDELVMSTDQLVMRTDELVMSTDQLVINTDALVIFTDELVVNSD